MHHGHCHTEHRSCDCFHRARKTKRARGKEGGWRKWESLGEGSVRATGGSEYNHNDLYKHNTVKTFKYLFNRTVSPPGLLDLNMLSSGLCWNAEEPPVQSSVQLSAVPYTVTGQVTLSFEKCLLLTTSRTSYRSMPSSNSLPNFKKQRREVAMNSPSHAALFYKILCKLLN